MHIIVFGALGQVGSRIAAEALDRRHRVTAAVRGPGRIPDLPPQVDAVVADASDARTVSDVVSGADLVVGATRPAPGNEHDLVITAKGLLAGTAASRVRLMLVGGASSLIVPGTAGRTVLDDPDHLHPAGRPIGKACADQLAACRHDTDADWTYLSPPASLRPGTRTGRYRVGDDELVVDEQGRSDISMEDFAVAILDEAEQPRHRGRRFTVAY